MADTTTAFRFFDPAAECHNLDGRHLPHWSQPGTVCFLTWRTWDSLPRAVVEAWQADRESWLRRHGIAPDGADWQARLRRLPPAARQEYHRLYTARWEAILDECHGECVLRQPALGGIVADSLQHFDGDRYLLSDFVVMPNHVHVLASFPNAGQMRKQCAGWKHYTRTRINKALGRHGRFWQVESFDHLVRSAEQFAYLRDYVADNPRRANLPAGAFIHYTREGS